MCTFYIYMAIVTLDTSYLLIQMLMYMHMDIGESCK